MDKTLVCGTGAPGSTPGESTDNIKSPKGDFMLSVLSPDAAFLKKSVA